MTTEIVALRDMLEMQAQIFEKLGAPRLMERIVLKHGVGGMGSPHNFKMLKMGECFYNAAVTACINNKHDLTYCEGYAIRQGLPLPIHHAWLMTPDNRVIDVTWNDATECEYLGLKIEDARLRRWLLKCKTYGILDTGRGLNIPFMREVDPDLVQEIVGEVTERRRHARA
jgi:hypothetical protein